MTMSTRLSKRRTTQLAGVIFVFAFAAAAAFEATLIAQSTSSAADRGLVGTWIVQVTLRNCTTNDAIGAPFTSLATFHRGGTGTGSTSNLAFAIGQRTQEHITWTHEGAGIYVQGILALILFDTPPNLPGPGFNPALPVSPGFSAGWQTVTHTIELINADEWRSSGTNAFYNVAGQQYRSGCSTATAQRFQ
jgi:hypothetical protein